LRSLQFPPWKKEPKKDSCTTSPAGAITDQRAASLGLPVPKDKPLSARQQLANRLMGKERCIVEQCFGTIKRPFGMRRTSYLGTVKVNAQKHLHESKKAVNKIFLDPP